MRAFFYLLLANSSGTRVERGQVNARGGQRGHPKKRPLLLTSYYIHNFVTEATDFDTIAAQSARDKLLSFKQQQRTCVTFLLKMGISLTPARKRPALGSHRPSEWNECPHPLLYLVFVSGGRVGV